MLRFPRSISGVVGAAALLSPIAANAQAISTRNEMRTGISQEQFLSLMGRLDALEKRNEELESQVRQLRAQDEAQATAATPKPADVEVTLANGRPTFETTDERFSALLRGQIQLDAGTFDQRAPGPLATDDRRGSYGSAEEADRARDLSDGVHFRRVRLGIEGKAWDHWSYSFTTDFGGSGDDAVPRLINAFMEYDGLGPVRLRAGVYAPPLNFDDGTSSTHLLFLERPSPAEVVRSQTGNDGRTAAAAMANGERWSLYAGLNGNLVDDETFDDQLGVTGRVTWLPYRSKSGLVHVGLNANVVVNPAADGPDVEPDGAETPIRLRDRPEIRVDGSRLVDTGAIDANQLSIYGGEFGLQHRALSLQAEYFHFEVDRRRSPLTDPDFDGWYVQAAWTATGQMRRYNARTAGFESPRVEKPFDLKRRTPGIWELAARYSVLDLNYAAGAPGTAPLPASIRGGEQKILTLAVNWYLNNNVRLMTDYQHVDVDRLSPGGNAFGAGALTPPAGAQIGQELSIWSLRAQYAF